MQKTNFVQFAWCLLFLAPIAVATGIVFFVVEGLVYSAGYLYGLWLGVDRE